jgi:hypothetical protein
MLAATLVDRAMELDMYGGTYLEDRWRGEKGERREKREGVKEIVRGRKKEGRREDNNNNFE